MLRVLEDLLSPGDEGWASITQWAAESPRTSRVLPVDDQHRDHVLLGLQVTTRSVLGAVAWHTSGLLVDHGWLRLFGGSGSVLPDLLTVNEPRLRPGEAPSYLVIAHDVMGGRFAVDGGGLLGRAGEVAYFAPDTLNWEPTQRSPSDFLGWVFTGDLESFYEPFRWPGWEAEVGATPLDQLLAVYPPLFTREGHDVAAASRRAVPWRELTSWYSELAGEHP